MKRQASLSITNSRSPPKLMCMESVMPSSHLILCHPLLLPSIFPSVRVFSYELALPVRWPKYWNFSFNISPSNEHPGLISFRMDWLDLLAVLGTLKSLLQYHRSKTLWIKWSKSIPEIGCSEKDQSGWAQIVDKSLRKAHTLDRRLYLCQFLMCNVCMTEVPLE